MVKLGHNIGDRVTIRRRSIGYAWRYCRHGSRGAKATPLDQTKFHTHSRGHTVVAACHSGMTLLGEGFPWQEPAHARGTTPAAAILHSVASSRRRQQSVAVCPPRSPRGQPQESKAYAQTKALPWQIQKITHSAKAASNGDTTGNSLSQRYSLSSTNLRSSAKLTSELKRKLTSIILFHAHAETSKTYPNAQEI